MRSRLVREVSASLIETGDVEIRGQVSGKEGSLYHATIYVWEEGRSFSMEGECSCPSPRNCDHAVAVLEYLTKTGKPDRIESAFGGVPHLDKVVGSKTLRLEEENENEDAGDGYDQEIEPTTEAEGKTGPTFLFRVERRPVGDGFAWLPDLYASAYAIYEGKYRVPLDPGGLRLAPIVTAERKIKRDRAAEMNAVTLLLDLSFLPNAEEPPQSLRKVECPDVEGTLWKPNLKEWVYPAVFWQRFRHEGVASLESRNWEVRFAPDVGHKPLVFRSESWSAEIVEEGKGWFHLSAGFEVEGEDFALQPILAALVENRFLEITEGKPDGQEFMIFLPDGRGLVLPIGRFRRILTTLGELLEYDFSTDRSGMLKLNKLDAAVLAMMENEAGGESGESLQAGLPNEILDLSERFQHLDRIEKVEVPGSLQATLRDYQLEGYRWMQFLCRHDLHGILADDMGLGKTIQTITHILAEKESERSQGRPSLVIAPTSVVENWQREVDKFAPSLSVLILQGASRKKRFRHISSSDVVLTSYALLYRDIEEFLKYDFHLLVLDEAQHIKNPDAQVTRAAARLRGSHRLCLSGTPVENNLGELWSLMNFLMPGLLGSKEFFQENYRNPIEKNQNERKAAFLNRRVGPLILRRTKNEVAKELPPKTEILHNLEMNELQKDLYETVRSTMDKQVRQALAIRGTEAQIVFLDALLKLRQICCHPSLIKNQSRAAESAKFVYLQELLETLRLEGHRILIFSQFTSMLRIIEEHLHAIECPYLKLTGETKNRQELVEAFQGGEGEVFLISLKAGGTGLTLTGADIVIHYDPWWNPAVEDQATDRAYRIGQDKPVFVHKLICKNTVEERIQKMQQKKSALAGGLLSGATQSLDLTTQLLGELLAESPIKKGED